MVPTVEDIEEYLESLEEFVSSSLSAATPNLPNVREGINRLWLDVVRFGPVQLQTALNEIHIPGLGEFEVPAPPPPQPPQGWIERTSDWAARHPWQASSIGVGILGVGLLAGYQTIQIKYGRHKRVKASVSPERRQVVVVLGGESPLGFPLVQDLERKGYIVIASAASPEAAEALESRCHGYVRYLVLDPSEPVSVPVFLRSLGSTLSRRFPINAHGDPHASPAFMPFIQAVICLLTLPGAVPTPSPVEHLPLHDSYMPYLLATHFTPIQVLQALLPLLRTTPSRSRDHASRHDSAKNIIVCVPATDARVGLPFAAPQAMSAAATLRGIDILRREIGVSAMTDKSDGMKNIRVVTVDVGAVGEDSERIYEPQEVYRAMEKWTPSEKLAYGGAFSSVLQTGPQHGRPRKPASIASVVDKIVEVVSGGRSASRYLLGIGLGFAKIRNWMRGQRFSVGAGARTYALASYLPSSILDALLSVPHRLLALRSSLSGSAHVPPKPAPRAAPPSAAPAPSSQPKKAPTASPPSSDPEQTTSETGSEADVESNEGDHPSVESSWVKA